MSPGYFVGGPNDGTKTLIETDKPYVVVVRSVNGTVAEHVYRIVGGVKAYGVSSAVIVCYEGPK